MSQPNSGGGLVKKLLFPSFTDAGSNDTFRPAASEDDATTQSDASTAIHDNRSLVKPQQHEVQYDGDRVGGYAPTSLAAAALLNSAASRPLNESLTTETGLDAAQQQQQQEVDAAMASGVPSANGTPPTPTSRAARFFPSTNPSATNSLLDAEGGPASPPPMLRRAPLPRSHSTTTRTGGAALDLSPRTLPFPSTSPRIRPVAADTVTDPQQTNNSSSLDQSSGKLDQSPVASPQHADIVTSSSNPSPDMSYSLDQSSATGTTASSGVVSSVLGYHFLDRTVEDDDEDTPRKSNLSLKNAEETPNDATRPITLAALMEMEQTDERADAMSDVNSNVSEFGTVVGAPGRLAEVEAMAADIESIESAEQTAPTTTPEPEEELELFRTTSSQSSRSPEYGDDDSNGIVDVASLSLPALDVGPQHLSCVSLKENQEDTCVQAQRDKNEGASTEKETSKNTSASAMVSAAFRRLGNGTGNLVRSTSDLVAPTTPQTPRTNALRRNASSRFHDAPPSSFLLRSPGSSAHFMSDRWNRTNKQQQRHKNLLLSPRFSNRSAVPNNQRQKQPKEPAEKTTENPNPRNSNPRPSPLRFARGCLSLDTSMDDHHFTEAMPERSPPRTRGEFAAEQKSNYPTSPNPRVMSLSKSWDVGLSMLTPRREGPYSKEVFSSYNVEMSSPSRKTAASAFRKAPVTGEGSRILHGTGKKYWQIKTEDTPTTGKNMSNFSPAIVNTQNAVALRTPHRIEIEREDALDILACLVERSVEFDREKRQASLESTIEEALVDGDEPDVVPESVAEKDDRVSTLAETGGRSEQVNSPLTARRRKIGAKHCFGVLDTESETEAIRKLREISENYEKNQTNGSQPSSADGIVDHEARMRAMDELLRSHTYAVEMKRAAMSASTWLRAIGRTDSSSTADEEREQPPEDQGEKLTGSEDVGTSDKLDDEEEPATPKSEDKMNLIAIKALLHSAELRAKEKEEQAQKLDEKLSECRAEIGRLKSSTRAEVLFTSPNRSILDDNDDDSCTSEEPSKADSDAAALDTDASPILEMSGEASGEGYTSFEPSFCRSEAASSEKAEERDKWEALADAKREAVLLKASLAQANEMIRKLHAESSEGNQREGDDTGEETNAPIVNIPNPELGKELDEYKEALKKAYEVETKQRIETEESTGSHDTVMELNSPSDKRTINVRMLDGENFVTEWDNLAPPLPPPPDHGLRAPIINALLEQWTSDQSMHNSLLSWMDKVLDGADPESVPPLTISSLNHQVRDGFAMHVLPLLLRRSDVHVEVTTRAHRTTTYDMAVTVKRSTPAGGASSNDDQSQASSNSNAYTSNRTMKKHNMMAYKASHGENPVVEEALEVNEGSIQSNAPGTVSDYLRIGNFTRLSESGSDSIAHSAITAQITNSSRLRSADGRLPPRSHVRGMEYDNHSDERSSAGMTHSSTPAMGDDVSVGSSLSRGSSQRSTQQPGLMSALGGAFGGLLSRRKAPSSQLSPLQSTSYDDDGWNDAGSSKHMEYTSFQTMKQPDTYDDLPPFLRPPASPAHGALSQRADEEEQPYHRVVSAPPGRIGVTFVQYRGHAMVSDVARESPLSGWVFPSDILIAIDEVPVSGMRVRDIVDILTARKERQRALRVISSHAMNEFTLNQSASEGG